MPNATHYCSGMSINAIAEYTDEDDSPVILKCCQANQSVVGSICWFPNITQPDLARIHSFLSSYTNRPSPSYWDAALYILHNIHSTHDHGISFISEDKSPLHTYLHFPTTSDDKAYDDTVTSSPYNSHKLPTYSDAC